MMIFQAFHDLTLSDYDKNGKLKKSVLKLKKSAHEFFQSENIDNYGMLAGFEDLPYLYKTNPNGIKLNHFEITRRQRKPYGKRRVKK